MSGSDDMVMLQQDIREDLLQVLLMPTCQDR